jgi:hypothetical protein
MESDAFAGPLQERQVWELGTTLTSCTSSTELNEIWAVPTSNTLMCGVCGSENSMTCSLRLIAMPVVAPLPGTGSTWISVSIFHECACIATLILKKILTFANWRRPLTTNTATRNVTDVGLQKVAAGHQNLISLSDYTVTDTGLEKMAVGLASLNLNRSVKDRIVIDVG